MKTHFLLALLFVGTQTFAQTYTVVADSLRLPVGIEFDAQGRLWVVESGFGFNDGAVSVVDAQGNLLPVLTQLPSFYDSTSQETVGPWHTLQLPNHRLALIIGATGQVVNFDLTGFVAGVSAPKTLVDQADALEIAGYALSHGYKETDPYTMAIDADGNRYVSDAAANAIFKVDVSGQITTLVDFPPIPNPLPVGPPVSDAVPTRVIAHPGGGLYVCQLTGFPFLEGAAQVYKVDPSGNVTVYASGLTTLSDMAFDPYTGDLYALQLGRFDLTIFNIAPNSSRISRIHPDGTTVVVAENLDYGSALALDAQGNMYVSELASGRILRLDNPASAALEPHRHAVDVSIAPNPASEFVRVRYEIVQPENTQLRVLDAQGRQVFQQDMGRQMAGAYQFDWHPGALPGGVYWIDIATSAAVSTQRLIWNP